jgi:hypothetical protein
MKPKINSQSTRGVEKRREETKQKLNSIRFDTRSKTTRAKCGYDHTSSKIHSLKCHGSKVLEDLQPRAITRLK